MNQHRFYTVFSAAVFSLFAITSSAYAQADYDAFATVAGTYRVPTQGQLQVTVQGNRVQLSANGQEAIDWLVGADAKTQAQHRRLNNLAGSIIGEMIEGRDDVRRQVLPPTSHSADLTQLFAVYTDALGMPTQFAVIGTAPRADGSRQTYIQLDFEERTMYMRLSWHGKMLNTITRSSAPTFEASCTAEAHQMNCSMLDEQTIALHRDDLGTVTQLVQTRKTPSAAYRVVTTQLARQ
ncbi:MAG: hypothetical protein AAGJ10_15440 [Bacteroidota bacterium]